jgi:hypothetical protein
MLVQLVEVSNLASRTTEMSVRIKADAIACPTLIAPKLASVDEHLQRVGAESFDLFQRYVATPQSRVRSFMHASLQESQQPRQGGG